MWKMWNYRLAFARSNFISKQCLSSKLSLDQNSTLLNRSLWNGTSNCRPRPNPFLSAFGTRLLRAFDRNLKSLFKIRRCTRNSVFGTLLEKRLIQVMLVDFGRSVTKSRDMLLSATCLSVYNWEDNSLHDEKIEHLASDVAFIKQLTLETLTCKSCQKRLRIDQKVPGIIYCTCSDSKPSSIEIDGWKPFIERPNTLVWRKEHEIYKGLYAYKMYARFETATAIDFLRVQLDTNFRKQWDTSATQLKIIEENKETNTDLVYWEMRWPRPFANRDYVFERKLTFIPKENVCVISSVATSHPSIPVNKSVHRVTEYWSYMVIKPFTDFEKPGTEFVLTYFDNPGLSIPSSVSTWVAMTGLPNFVSKLGEAASQVTDLESPEPALMHSLRAQMEAHLGNAATSVKVEELFTIELSTDDERILPSQPVQIQEEISSVTIVEETSILAEEDQLQETVTTQEEISFSVVVEAEPTLSEKPNQTSILIDPLQCPTLTDSKMDASLKDTDQGDMNVNQESTDSQDEPVTTTPPVSPTALTINISPPISPPPSSTASSSCSENTQFLASRNPVYA